MTKIKAELLLASKNIETGDILYTWRLTFPRCILSEVNTHRVASRNTSSSRAIPGRKQRAAVYSDPFVPVYIGSAQKGMKAGAELEGWRRKGVELVWKASRYPQLLAAYLIEKLGAHKQIANRLIEPYVWTVQIFSATEVDNFFLLRDHHMAEPHFHELARQMHEQVKYVRDSITHFDSRYAWDRWDKDLTSKIQYLSPGEWHLPLLSMKEYASFTLEGKKILSAARCAVTSYTSIEDGREINLETAERIFHKTLMASSGPSDPKHLSPVEHQAMAMHEPKFYANFKGFKQYRKEIEDTL